VNIFRMESANIRHLLLGNRGATTVEYAVVVAALITAAFVLIIFGMANPEGDGVTQQAFQNVGDRVGQFGKIE
jgi:Flp pilus assembly pilin Flp